MQLFRGLDATKQTADALNAQFKKLVSLSAASIQTGTPDDVLTLLQVRPQKAGHGSTRPMRRYHGRL